MEVSKIINILIDELPNTVKIDNEEYKINSGFRESILFELMMQDTSISEKDKIIQALELYYPILPNPKNINEAIEQMLWFYRCGKDEIKSKGSDKGNSKQVYSYDYDDAYIYSAFKQTYDINLQSVKYLHWWEFKAMLECIWEECLFSKIMGYRAMDINKIKDKEEKAHYKKMKELYKIPSNISKDEEEKLDEINQILLHGGDVSKVL